MMKTTQRRRGEPGKDAGTNTPLCTEEVLRLPGNPYILIHGCYGEKNAGDEALLEATLHVLRGHLPEARLCVFSETPEITAAAYGVESLSNLGIFRWRSSLSLWRSGQLSRVLAALWSCDCLVLGGGELLRTDFGWRALSSILDRVVLARLMGKPVLILGVGIGKLEPGLRKRLILWACAGAIVLTREEESAATLTSFGVPGVRSIPDLAFQLPDEDHGLILPKRPRIAFCLLNPTLVQSCRELNITYPEFVAAMAKLADEAAGLGAQVVFVPFNFHGKLEDRIVHRDVLSRMSHPSGAMLLEDELAPARLKALLGDMDLVVGMRFHSCVFAMSHARPLLALAYDQKVSKVMGHFQLGEYSVPLNQLARAPDLLRDLWCNRASWTSRVTPLVERDQRAFERTFALALGLEQSGETYRELGVKIV